MRGSSPTPRTLGSTPTPRPRASSPLQRVRGSSPSPRGRDVGKVTLMTDQASVANKLPVVGEDRGGSMSVKRLHAGFRKAVLLSDLRNGSCLRDVNAERDGKQKPSVDAQKGVQPACKRSPRKHWAGFVDERCSRCTMEAVWNVCDVFWEFDPQHVGEITRNDYIQKLGDFASVKRWRILRRSGLQARFYDSAAPVSLEEMIRLTWPSATDDDWRLMREWARLREAHSVLSSSAFQGTEQELVKVFKHLDLNDEGQLRAKDLVRTRILEPNDIRRLLKTSDIKSAVIDKDTFRQHIWPELRSRNISQETLAKMRQEEESCLNSAFAGAFTMGVDKVNPKSSTSTDPKR